LGFEEGRDFVVFLRVVVFEEFGLFAFEGEAGEFPFEVLEDGAGGAGGLFAH
jgi:hypothetical protein